MIVHGAAGTAARFLSGVNRSGICARTASGLAPGGRAAGGTAFERTPRARINHRGTMRMYRTAAQFLLCISCATALAISCAHAPTGGGAIDSVRANEAIRLIHAGNYEDASSILAPLVAQNPRSAELTSLLGEAQWKLGKYEEAVASFESSLRLDYGNYRTHMMLAQMLMEHGKSGRALTEFELAVQYSTNQALPHYNYGLALYQLGRREDALEQWRIAYRIEGDNPAYAMAMGMALTGVDDGEALTYFERAAALGENGPQFHHNFGILLERLGENGRAADQLERAFALSPGDRGYEFDLAALHMKTAAYEKALPLLDELAAAAPGNRTYRTYQAKANLELGRYESAIRGLSGVVDAWERTGEAAPSGGSTPTASGGVSPAASGNNAPSLDQALDILAMAYRGAGDTEKSLAAIRAAVSIAPESTLHLINYGVILVDNGKIPEAIAQWEKVLVLDPGNEIARRNLSAYRGRR
jgi:tetratricopeptide (TPR) repeat protein